jgi:hypothetical protein
VLGSPAVFKGVLAGAPTVDERGFPRQRGGTVDVGAYEHQGSGAVAVVTLPVTTSASGGTALESFVSQQPSSSSPVTVTPPVAGTGNTQISGQRGHRAGKGSGHAQQGHHARRPKKHNGLLG